MTSENIILIFCLLCCLVCTVLIGRMLGYWLYNIIRKMKSNKEYCGKYIVTKKEKDVYEKWRTGETLTAKERKIFDKYTNCYWKNKEEVARIRR